MVSKNNFSVGDRVKFTPASRNRPDGITYVDVGTVTQRDGQALTEPTYKIQVHFPASGVRAALTTAWLFESDFDRAP